MYAVGGNLGYIFFGFIISHYQKEKKKVYNIAVKCLNTFAIILIVSNYNRLLNTFSYYFALS